jgi:hypothetical protein
MLRKLRIQLFCVWQGTDSMSSSEKKHLGVAFKKFITIFHFCAIYNVEAYEYKSGHLALRPQVLTALCQLEHFR